MTIRGLDIAPSGLRRRRRPADGRRGGRVLAMPHPPLAWRRPEPAAYTGAAILDLALCLILSATVVGLLLLAL